MGALAAMAVVGGGLSAYGAIKSAQDQSDLENKKAQIAFLQANEIQQREIANDAERKNQAYQNQLNFGAEFAGSGKEGAGIGSQLEIKRQSDLATLMADRDASFQEQMLMTTGQINQQLASDTMQSGYINAAGSLLGGAGRAGQISAYTSKGSPQALGTTGG